MKKHFFVYLFAALTMGAVFTSCGDDDDPTPKPTPKPEVVCPVAETTFSATNGLELSYSGQPMKGKVVKFTPDAKDATKATLVLSGDEYGLMGGKPQAIAGVVPGELSTTINVDLTIDGEKVTFSGKDEKDGRVIEYKGEATKSSMNLTLDVTMPVNVLTGRTFKLDDPQKAITLKWDADRFPFAGGDWSIQDFFSMVMMMAKVENHTIPECLAAVFSEVSFLPDGNIQAKYRKDLKGGEWETSPFNVATYTVTENGKIMLYVNPMQIAFITKAVDMGEIMGGLMMAVSEAMINGVPVSFTEKDGAFSAYLDEEALLPILKQVKPLFEDKQFVTMIVELLKKKAPADMAPMVGLIQPVLEGLPIVIDSTRDIHIGINMVEKK